MSPTLRRDWYHNELRSIFGNVEAHRRGEYTVFEATNEFQSYAKTR